MYNRNMDAYFHINKTFIDSPLTFGDISLIQIGRIFLKENTGFEPHMHKNWFELTIITDGEGDIGTNDVVVPVKSGEIYLSFPAELHKIYTKQNQTLKYDFFSFSTADKIFKQELDLLFNNFQDAHKRIICDEKISSLVANAINEFCQTEGFLSQKLLKNIFEEIIIYLVRDFKEKSSPKAFRNIDQADVLCYQIMSYIDLNIFSLNNLQQIATSMNYNYNYLSTIFKKNTKQTISDYYQNAKLKTAKLLIEENKLTITKIASLLNYSSVYVFSRAYKHKYGISPSKTNTNK